jgi:hypothetical protein
MRKATGPGPPAAAHFQVMPSKQLHISSPSRRQQRESLVKKLGGQRHYQMLGAVTWKIAQSSGTKASLVRFSPASFCKNKQAELGCCVRTGNIIYQYRT